jgi:hypothetical protein
MRNSSMIKKMMPLIKGLERKPPVSGLRSRPLEGATAATIRTT